MREKNNSWDGVIRKMESQWVDVITCLKAYCHYPARSTWGWRKREREVREQQVSEDEVREC